MAIASKDPALEAGSDRTYVSQVERGTRRLHHHRSGPLGACSEDYTGPTPRPHKRARGSIKLARSQVDDIEH